MLISFVFKDIDKDIYIYIYIVFIQMNKNHWHHRNHFAKKRNLYVWFGTCPAISQARARKTS